MAQEIKTNYHNADNSHRATLNLNHANYKVNVHIN